MSQNETALISRCYTYSMTAADQNISPFIRKAAPEDVSRIAEILVFSKRTHYRAVFQDDAFSFGELQVFPIARDLLEHPERLCGYSVYDDGFVKGLIHLEGDEIAELYADPFFERQHIGSALISYALSRILHPYLWVLEGNENAIRFYRSMGFDFTGERKLVPGTPKYESRMHHQAPADRVIGKVVRVTIDRPMGSSHPDHQDLIYPVNYGFVEGVEGGDGEWQDAYVLGPSVPVEEFAGQVTAVIRREDDTETKWVVVPEGTDISNREILDRTNFQEKYFRSRIIRNAG